MQRRRHAVVRGLTPQLSSGGAPESWKPQKHIMPRRLLQRLVWPDFQDQGGSDQSDQRSDPRLAKLRRRVLDQALDQPLDPRS